MTDKEKLISYLNKCDRRHFVADIKNGCVYGDCFENRCNVLIFNYVPKGIKLNTFFGTIKETADRLVALGVDVSNFII